MAVLKIFKPHLLPNPKSHLAQTWWEALVPHGDLELLKSFRSKMAAMSVILKVFKQHLLPNC